MKEVVNARPKALSSLRVMLAGLFIFYSTYFEAGAQGSDDFFIYGQVVLQSTGQPEANYPVNIRVNPSAGFPVYNISTDAQGNFSLNIPSASLIGNNLDIITEVSSCQGLLTQTISNNFGFTDSAQVLFSICVSNPCVVGFTYSRDSIGNTLFFNGSDSGAVSVFYQFGDGSPPVTTSDTSHTYSQPGIYQVCITGIDSNGNTCQHCDSVIAYGSGGCAPNFSYSSTVLGQPNNLTFFNQSLSSDSITSIFYDFGDGSNYFATGADVWSGVSHLFVSPGDVEVCLTIQDAGFCQNTICQLLSIITDSCSVPLNVSSQISGDSILWEISIPNPSLTAYYYWDFQGISGTGQAFQFYTDSSFVPGYYEYCLQIIDTSGNCFSIQCDSIGVNQPVCQSFFISIPDPINPNDYQFQFQGSGAASFYSWTITTPGGDVNLTGTNISYTFPGQGSYPVCLEMSGPGCSSNYCDTIVVAAPPVCAASFSVQPLGFSATFSCSYQSNSGGAYEYRLYTGDGSVLNFTGDTLQHTFNHTYPGGGSYQVCLRVADTSGICTDSICMNLNLGGFGPGLTGVYIYAEQSGAPCSDCEVLVLMLDSLSGRWQAIDTLSNDSSGYFSTGLSSGTYLFRAEANSSFSGYESLMPTYQGDVLFWSSGVPTLLPQQTSAFCGCYVDTIRLVTGTIQGGTAGIEGNIREGGFRAEGDPIGGVDILLLEINQLAIKRTKSAQNGTYSLTNLDAGTYWVYPEVINRITYPVMVELTQDSTEREVNLSVEQDIVFGLGDGGIESTSFRAYPNPVREAFKLSFGAKNSGMVVVSLLDMQGRCFLKQWYPVASGRNDITIDLAMLEGGTYLIRVQSGEAAVKNISVVKIP